MRCTLSTGSRSKLECRRTDTAFRSEHASAPLPGRKNLATIFHRALALAFTGSTGAGPVG